MKGTFGFGASDIFTNFTWDHGAGLLAAAIGALITVVVAVAGYLSSQAAVRRERQAADYAEALRAVEDYLEGPYRIRRRDGSAEQRLAITTWLSDVKSRHNYHRGLMWLHAPDDVADAYDKYIEAAIDEAGPQMTHAWGQQPTSVDAQVPLGSGYNRAQADRAKKQVVTVMKRNLDHRWWRSHH